MNTIDSKAIQDINAVLNEKFHNENNSLDNSHENLWVRESGTSELFNRWLEYVKNHNYATIFNHPLWIQALEREFNRKAVILYCEDEKGQLKGLLPLLPTLGMPFKKMNQ